MIRSICVSFNFISIFEIKLSNLFLDFKSLFCLFRRMVLKFVPDFQWFNLKSIFLFDLLNSVN